MTGMKLYYSSRAIVSAAFAVTAVLSGSSWGMAILMSLLMFGLFLWAPHSGRYAVHPEFGITALRRDEYTQAINDKAARNAFVATMLALGGSILYFAAFALTSTPLAILKWVLILGALTYFVSDLWLRKAQR